jgi:hypothetical protein
MIRNIIFIFILSIFIAVTKDLMAIEARILFHDSAKYDVFIYDNKKITNLTKYNNWEYIRECKISDNNNYIFVWHKPKEAKKLILSIYDVNNNKLIKEIIPGYGGEIIWLPGDRLFHLWGCGSNCYVFNLYDCKLNKIEFPKISIDDIWGGYKISPKKDRIIFYSMWNVKYSVIDLISMKEILFNNINENSISDVNFVDDYTVNIDVKYESGKTVVNRINVR